MNVRTDEAAESYYVREIGQASSTGLNLILRKSPAHYKAWIESGIDHETPAKVFGKAYHCAVLEPEKFAATYIGEPQDAPKDLRCHRNAAKPGQSTLDSIAFWDAWDEQTRGKIVLTADQFALIETMKAALFADPYIAAIFSEGEAEVTIRWTDPETGLPCKLRADWRRRGKFLADLKSTEDASPEGFARSIVDYGYDVQHAHYCEGCDQAGEPIENYLIVVQEKAYPYVAQVYQVDAVFEARGFARRARALGTLAECVRTGIWPTYRTGITEISPPAWASKD